MAKWINCKKCGHEYHSSLNCCPECSTPTPSFKKIIAIFTCILFCAIVVVGIVLGFKDNKIKPVPQNSEVTSTVADSSEVESKKVSSETESDESVPSKKPDTSSSRRTEAASSKKDISSATSQKPSSSVISGIHDIISSEEATSSNSPTGSDNTAIGTVLKNKFAYTTVPEYYLRYLYNIMSSLGETMKFEDFAYKLSEEDINYGFTEVRKNADGSATIIMPLNETRIKFRTEYIAAGVKLIEDAKQSGLFNDVYGNNEYRDIFFELKNEELSDNELATIILIGLYFLENQYYEVDSGNSCNVYIVYPSDVYSLLKFPDILLR